MARTVTNTPEPRYVERARHCDNAAGDGEAASYYSVTALYQDDGGFVLEYENDGTIHIPLEGTDDVIVDVDENNKMINIHLDASVRNKLARMLVSPTQAPTEQSFVVIGTNNAQALVTLTELKSMLGL